MLTYKTQVESTKLRCKKGLSALKAMASKGIEQRHQQRTHPLRPCATYWTCHPWKQDIRWSKSERISMRCRIPKNRLHDAVKEEKGVDWQEASHGWARQNNQSSMCAVSQSSSKQGTGKNAQLSSSPTTRLCCQRT